MIRHGYLYSDHFVDEHDVPFHIPGERGPRIGIGPGQHITGQTFFIQRLTFCLEVFQAPGDSIRSQKTQDRCDPALEDCAQTGFRDPCPRSLFPTASGDMFMAVDIARCQPASVQLQFFHFPNPIIFVDGRSNPDDFSAFHQDILHTFWFRSI